jgi:hypothetical protein
MQEPKGRGDIARTQDKSRKSTTGMGDVKSKRRKLLTVYTPN